MSTSETPGQATSSAPQAQADADRLKPVFRIKRDDLLLVLGAAVLGLAAAAVFAAYQAVSLDGEAVAGRLAEFAANLLWPGVLIFAGVAVIVIGGWKANLD
jgi:hypothetical protein